MNFTTIHYAVTDGVVTITLDRPEARNALNRAMCEELIEAAAAAAAADSVHLVLVRGNGPVFCAGADLKERKDMGIDEVRSRRLRGLAAYNALEALPMPTVAVVHGAAIGSGTEIAASCDFIVATPQATFATPEALWGDCRRHAATAARARQAAGEGPDVHRPKALGRRRQNHGLVTRIVEADLLDAALAELAQTIGKASSAGLRQAKRCINEGSELDPRGAFATEILAIEENLAQDAWRSRMAGFKS